MFTFKFSYVRKADTGGVLRETTEQQSIVLSDECPMTADTIYGAIVELLRTQFENEPDQAFDWVIMHADRVVAVGKQLSRVDTPTAVVGQVRVVKFLLDGTVNMQVWQVGYSLVDGRYDHVELTMID